MRYLAIVLVFVSFQIETADWKKIDEGLYLLEYKSPIKSTHDNSIITVLKVDPKKYNFSMFSNLSRKTAKEWSDKYGLSAVINAGMYDEYSNNIGYMKDYENEYNPKLNSNNTVLAFNRISDDVAPIQIIDLKEQDWSILNKKYETYTQSIRMVDLHGNNKWSQQNKKWSMVVIAMDKQGNALFIHTRSPYTVHDFINILMAAPLNIKNVMYLEGGPEASFYLNQNGTEISRVGSYETDFMEDNSNTSFWPIPNIIAITKK